MSRHVLSMQRRVRESAGENQLDPLDSAGLARITACGDVVLEHFGGSIVKLFNRTDSLCNRDGEGSSLLARSNSCSLFEV